MKTNLIRNNPRKAQANTLQSKTIHSQSPTHKKLLKKIELTQREAPNQYDLSLQDNLVQKPQVEVVDFRVEIELRFQKSLANHTYIFPRNNLQNYDGALDDSSSSHDSSIDSLRHVTVYELVSQNKKRVKHSKSIYKAQDEYIGSGRDNRSYRAKDQVLRTEPDQDSDTDGDYDTENPETPIEIRIRDKNSSTYKKLLNLLERQLNRPPSAIPTGKRDIVQLEDSNHKKDDHLQVSSQKPASQLKKETSRDKMPTANTYVMKNNLVKDDSQRKLGYHIGKYRIGESEIRNTEKSESGISLQDTSKKVKKSTRTPDNAQRFKMMGRDKGNSVLDASHGGENSQISLDSRLSPKSKKTLNESAKLSSQDSKKKLYSVASSNGLLRALTPKALASKNIINLKDKVEKNTGQQARAEPYLMSQQTPSSNLYQKAQDDVLNGKLRISSASTQKATKKTAPSTEARESSTKRDKDDSSSQALDIKGINFVDFYGSPKSQTGKSSAQITSQSVYNNFAKMRNIRKIDGDRSSERQLGYVSYDLVNKNSATKPAFKLDLSNRVPKQRDMLSSTRTRENQSKEKSSDLLSIDSILKGSYEHSLVRNASAKHLEASKKKLGITPKGNISKVNLMS